MVFFLVPRVIEPQGVLDFAKIFGNNNDVALEIGFGNGDTLVAMAQEAAHNLANPLPCGKYYQFLIEYVFP
jgi:tRNA G46 methylase TrmB